VNIHDGGQSRLGWICAALIPAIALVVVPSFSSPFLGAKTTALLVAGALAALGMIRLTNFKIIPAIPFAWAALFCMLAGIISTLHARNWAECWHALAPIVAAALFLIVLLGYRVSAQAILVAIAISAIIVAVLAIAGRFGYDLPLLIGGTAAPGRMRTASTLGNPLFVSSFLACAFWAVLILPVHFVWRVIAGLVTIAGMLVTTERTGIFALVLGIIVYALAGPRRQRLLRLSTVLILVVVVFSFVRGNPRSLKITGQGRIFLWKTALHQVTLLGGGPGSFYRVYNHNLRETAKSIPANELHFVNYETDSYDIFVQVIVEEGLLGLAASLAFFAAWFRMAWLARKTNAGLCAMAAVATFLATGLSDDPLSRPEGLVLLAAWLAVPALVLFRDNLFQDRLFRDKSAIFKLESSRLYLSKISPVMMLLVSLLLLAAAAVTAFSNSAVRAGENTEDRNDWARAERWDRAVLKYDPAERDAHYNLVRALAQQGQYEASLAESEKAMGWVDEAELHLIRIRILPIVGKTAQARDELARSREEFPWSEELQQEAVPGSN
jgi:hypothetical protein